MLSLTGSERKYTGQNEADTDRQHHAAQRLHEHHRLTRFSGGYAKDQARAVHGDARSYPFIQLNHPDWLNFICVDVDHEDGYERLLYPGIPRPHAIIRNPANGHAQGFWMIDPVYIGDGARPRPRLFYDAVRNALTNAVGGDHAFTGHLVRNPFAYSPTGPVSYSTRQEPWPLRELKAHLITYRDPALEALGYEDEQPNLWNPAYSSGASSRVQRGLTAHAVAKAVGRNCAIFYATRARLWVLHREGRRIEDEAHSIAHQINAECNTPLGGREVDGIAASAIRQVYRGKGRPQSADGQYATDAYLSALGARGGRARTQSKIRAAAINLESAREKLSQQTLARAKEALRLRRRGEVAASIARALGCSTRTVRRYFRMMHERAAWVTAQQLMRGGDNQQATGSPGPHPGLPAVLITLPQARLVLRWLRSRTHLSLLRSYPGVLTPSHH